MSFIWAVASTMISLFVVGVVAPQLQSGWACIVGLLWGGLVVIGYRLIDLVFEDD